MPFCRRSPLCFSAALRSSLIRARRASPKNRTVIISSPNPILHGRLSSSRFELGELDLSEFGSELGDFFVITAFNVGNFSSVGITLG